LFHVVGQTDNDEANVAFPNFAIAHQKLSDYFPYRNKLKINTKRKPTRFEIFTAGTSRRHTSDIAGKSWKACCECDRKRENIEECARL